MKKAILIVLCLLLGVFGLVGCNFEKVEINKINPDASVDQKIELNLLMPYISEGDINKIPTKAVIDSVTGYISKYFQLPTASAAETQLNSIFIDKSTNYHALKLTKNQFNRYAVKSSAFADITDVVNSPKFAVMKGAIKKEAWAAVTYDGRILGIPESSSSNNIDKSIIIRKDLMIKYGFNEVPKTLEEFKALLQKFKDDTGSTTAFSVPKNISLVPQIAAATGVKQYWQDVNGELVNAIENPNMKTYIDYMKDLKNANLLDSAMQENTFATCASNFAEGKSIATISNFWEMATISANLDAQGKSNYENFVDFAYAFEDKDKKMTAYQNSGVNYVTVVPNWMASTGIHVMNYAQEKLREDSFIKIVAGDENVHYRKNAISNEFEPTAQFKADKVNADHFLTGTNDNVYGKYWTQVVIKGNKEHYFQWLATNTIAFEDGLIGITDPTKFASPLSKYSETAAALEDGVDGNIVKMIYGNDSKITIDTSIAAWKQGTGDVAIKEIRQWYKDSKK